MATKEAPKKDEAEAAAEAPPPKKSKKLLFILVGAVVAAILIGLLVGRLVFGGKHGAAADDQAADDTQIEAPDPAEKAEPRKPPIFVNLEPFTVNLQPENNGDQFLQVVATLRVADEKTGEDIKAYMPQIRNDMLSVLSAKHAPEISTPDGREALADELKDTVNAVLGYTPPPP
ncbi:MAG TPA: flagellar basal body-associated FliL family protein, partial [Rhodocyclaceae bacterium]|nr:flagellar basal body-associated FliL family protein [Rhodocyclaceae bacterium]